MATASGIAGTACSKTLSHPVLRNCRLLVFGSTLLLSITGAPEFVFSQSVPAPFMCRTKVLTTPYRNDNSPQSDLRCDEGEVLIVGEQITPNGVTQCGTPAKHSEDGQTWLIGNCKGPTAPNWIAQITCCTFLPTGDMPDTTAASQHIFCSTEARKGEIQQAIPETWQKARCTNGTLITAHSFQYPSGQGNCPVRIQEDGGETCATVTDCGLPLPQNKWVLELICCSDGVPETQKVVDG